MKTVANHRYVHVSALDQLLQQVTSVEKEDILWCCDRLSFDVVKLNDSTKRLSLIVTDGWDSRYEPIIVSSDIFDISEPGKPKFVRTLIYDNRVYHRKHEFVKDDYSGFDVKESRSRTASLELIPEIRESKTRIGSRKYWESLLEKYNLPVYMP